MDKIYDATGRILEISDGHGQEYYEEIAKTKLTGKVLISFGDSYTNAMSGLFSTMATKYGMIHDGRGVVSSPICDRGGTQPMVNRVDTIVSDYTSGFTINGNTYYKDDVAIITFMGGANDPGGIAAYGTGIHSTGKNVIYGATQYIFNTLLENFTKATIICITQPSSYNASIAPWITDDASAQRFGFDTAAEALAYDDVQFSNYMMANKEAIVKECAWYYGVPIVDMFHEFPSILNPANRSTYWNSDKLHLTTAGYKIVASGIDKKIVDIFGKEPSN